MTVWSYRALHRTTRSAPTGRCAGQPARSGSGVPTATVFTRRAGPRQARLPGSSIPGYPGRAAELGDADVGTLADSYADLAARPAAVLTRRGAPAGHRVIAPTAASKIMFALRPETVPPWDAAIARATAGGTSRDHFASHLE